MFDVYDPNDSEWIDMNQYNLGDQIILLGAKIFTRDKTVVIDGRNKYNGKDGKLEIQLNGYKFFWTGDKFLAKKLQENAPFILKKMELNEDACKIKPFLNKRNLTEVRSDQNEHSRRGHHNSEHQSRHRQRNKNYQYDGTDRLEESREQDRGRDRRGRGGRNRSYPHRGGRNYRQYTPLPRRQSHCMSITLGVLSFILVGGFSVLLPACHANPFDQWYGRELKTQLLYMFVSAVATVLATVIGVGIGRCLDQRAVNAAPPLTTSFING